MMRWYAAYAKPRMELWARSNLWEREFEVYLPQYRKTRRHARRIDEVTVPLFPRYLFVHADLERQSLRSIATAPGVESVVTFGNRPAGIDDRIIAEIRGREDEHGLVAMDCLEERFRRGQALRINAGALRDYTGLFEAQDDKHRVVLLLGLLGRQVRVRVPLEQVSQVG